MFEASSRYKDLPTAEITLVERNGTRRVVRYVRRRFIPMTRSILSEEHTVIDGERVDTIAAGALGNPKLFWRICDTNRVLVPFDLVAQPGAVVVIDTLSSSTEE